MVEEFQMGSVGPDDEPETSSVFIPNPSPPVDDEIIRRAKFSNEVGDRKFFTFMEVFENDEKLEWVVEDLLPDTGLMYVGGLSGTGKTILAIQLVINIVLGRPTMTFRFGSAWHEGFVGGMLSLEMGLKELQLRLQHMYPNLTEEEQKILADRFLIYCDPEPFNLWDEIHAAELARFIKKNGIQVLLIDSASVSFAASLKDDSQVNKSIQHLYTIRNRLNCAMVVVSHTRKPPAGIASNPEDITINELFGHSGVAQSAASILIMVEDEKARKATIKNGDADKTEKLVHIINAKARFDANGGAFKSYLTSKDAVKKGEPLMFKRNAIPIAPSEKKVKTSMPSLGDFKFGSLLDDDDDE